MARFDYAKAEALAKRLIERFGQTVTQHVIANTGDAWNPTQTELDPAPTLTAAVLNYRTREIDGTLIKASDKKVVFSTEAMTVALDVAHKVTIGGTKYSVLDVRELNPGGAVVYYEARCRK
jgi:hypothetical protein